MTRALMRVAASVGLLALVLYFAGPQRILATLGNAEPLWLALAFLSAIAATLTSALRWHALAGWLGLAATRRDLIVAYYRGVAANTVLPGGNLGGDALRVVQLQRLGNPLGAAAASVALDRMSGLWVLVVLALAATTIALGFDLLPSALLPVPTTVSAGLTFTALLGPVALWQASHRLHVHLPEKLERAFAALHDRPAPVGHLAAQFLWSGGVQAFSILAFALGARAVGLDLPAWTFIIAAGPIFILAALPVSIGGWGTREAAAAMTLGHFGAAHEQAVAAAVFYGLFAAAQGALGALSLIISNKETPS